MDGNTDEQPAKKGVKPQSLVTEEHVRAALKADKGGEALLTSWSVVDFTKQGDNYACVVSSVIVKFSLNHNNMEVVYIVKLNPCRNLKEFQEFTGDIFYKESEFYLSILPELNSTLTEIGKTALRLPKCFYSSLETDNEIIFLEDLRPRGFRMFDRKRGLDVPHATLILEELARLHAASRLMQAKTPDQNLAARRIFLKDIMTGDSIVPVLTGEIDHGIKILEQIGGYERSIAWLQSFRPNVKEILAKGFGRSQYDVVCHGDCWNNNVLFRYNDNGDPVEVMLLDLQITRLASPACDLNYLLFTSVTGEVRKPNLEAFLEIYHTTFASVMEAADKDMIFTSSELLQEFRDKNILGIIFGLMIVPMILCEPEDSPNLEDATDLEALMEEFGELGLKSLETNPLMRPRFLALFDEMMEVGLIP